MNRINAVLAATLVLQLLLFSAVLALCGPQSSHVEPVTLLEGLDREAVERITIEGRIGDTRNKATLARSGDAWTLPQESNYPADKSKVDRLLSTLVGLTSSRIVARGPEHRVELKVADDEFQRKLTIEANGQTRTLWVGSSASSNTTCARADGREETFATEDLKTWDLADRPNDWYAQPYFELTVNRLAAITIEGPKGKLTMERTSLAGWTLDEKPVDQQAADDLLDQLERIELSDVRCKSDDPAVQKALSNTPKRYTISLALAKDPLPVMPPVPEPSGPVDDPEAGQETPPEPPPPPKPQISERKTLIIIATPPGDDDKLLVHAEGHSHVVLVSGYRLDKVTGATADKLTATEEQH